MRCLTEAAGSQSSWLRCLTTCPGQTSRTVGWSVGSGETSLTGLQSAVFSVLSLPWSRYVGEGHPAKRNYYRWSSGEARLTSLYCGGEVRLVCSDQTNIYCGLKGGVILVFRANTLLFLTRLEEKESHLWQLQVSPPPSSLLPPPF